MDRIISRGQLVFGIAIAAYGFEDLICAHFGLTVAGVPWFPLAPFWGYVTGIALIVASLCIVTDVQARLTGILLGILFLFYVLLLELPDVIARPMSVSTRTVFFEALSMCAAAFILASSIPTAVSRRPWERALDMLIASGPYLFGVSAIVFGIDHFLVLAVIASLVPAWMHLGMFWAYLTGAAFVAAGVSIVIKRMDQWAGFMLGLMFLLWFLLLHSPRVVSAFRSHDPNLPDEWSSAFIALAMCGGSWICAWRAHQRGSRTTE